MFIKALLFCRCRRIEGFAGSPKLLPRSAQEETRAARAQVAWGASASPVCAPALRAGSGSRAGPQAPSMPDAPSANITRKARPHPHPTGHSIPQPRTCPPGARPPPRLRQPHLENCVSEGRPLGGPGDPPASWGSPSAVGRMSGLYSGVWGHCRAQTAPTEPASLRAGRLRWVLTPGRCGARTRCSMSPR